MGIFSDVISARNCSIKCTKSILLFLGEIWMQNSLNRNPKPSVSTNTVSSNGFSYVCIMLPLSRTWIIALPERFDLLSVSTCVYPVTRLSSLSLFVSHFLIKQRTRAGDSRQNNSASRSSICSFKELTLRQGKVVNFLGFSVLVGFGGLTGEC